MGGLGGGSPQRLGKLDSWPRIYYRHPHFKWLPPMVTIYAWPKAKCERSHGGRPKPPNKKVWVGGASGPQNESGSLGRGGSSSAQQGSLGGKWPPERSGGLKGRQPPNGLGQPKANHKSQVTHHAQLLMLVAFGTKRCKSFCLWVTSVDVRKTLCEIFIDGWVSRSSRTT